MANRLDELTYYQKVAIEGEIASLLANVPHNEEIAFRTYFILSNIPEKYRNYSCECLRNMVEIPEIDFERIKCEVELGAVPVWLWVNKVIADLKESITLTGQLNIGTADINRVRLKKKILESSFISLCRKAILIYPEAVIDLCNKILEESKLDFLYNACFVMQGTASLSVESLEDLRVGLSKSHKKKILKKRKKLLSINVDLRDLLGFTSEMRKQEIADKALEAFKQLQGVNETDEITEEVNKGFSKPNFKFSYIVQKILKGSGTCVNLKTFSTRREAVAFIREVKEQFPDLESTCTFVILEMKS